MSGMIQLRQTHPLMLHLVGIFAVFSLLTLIGSSDGSSAASAWGKTLLLYVLVLLLIKSKWYFVAPAIVLLLIDQTLEKDLQYRKGRSGDGPEREGLAEYEARVARVSRMISAAVVSLAVFGTIHYVYTLRLKHNHAVSLHKVLFGFCDAEYHPAECPACAFTLRR